LGLNKKSRIELPEHLRPIGLPERDALTRDADGLIASAIVLSGRLRRSIVMHAAMASLAVAVFVGGPAGRRMPRKQV